MSFAAMQPYFLPYLGYYQLLSAVDTFVIYDNVEYTKKGWISRNRFLMNGKPQYFSVNLEKASDFATIRERRISPVFKREREKILNRMNNAYRRAPFFEETYPLLSDCMLHEEPDLFRFILNSVELVAGYLDINTNIIILSTLSIDHNLRNKHKLWAISQLLKDREYINPIGGMELYEKGEFLSNGVELSFHEADLPEYDQGSATSCFEPAMSIVDVLMFNGRDKTKELLKSYNLR